MIREMMQTVDDTAELDLDLVISPEASVCRVFYRTTAGQVRDALGWAKKHPDDSSDRQVAELLAVGRALRQMAESMIRDANNIVDAGGTFTWWGTPWLLRWASAISAEGDSDV